LKFLLNKNNNNSYLISTNNTIKMKKEIIFLKVAKITKEIEIKIKINSFIL
jgi:hypothetical protein